MDVHALHKAIADVCPIDGVSIGNPKDKATWRVDFSAEATGEQKARALAVVEGFDPGRPSAPSAVLPQDLMAQLTADDAAKIRGAVETNAEFWLLWLAMQAQKDPMLVTNDRFLSGWAALVQVLGRPRMDEIAAALDVVI